MRVVLLAPGAGTAARVPVLACADALRTGADVQVVEVDSETEVDAALSDALGPPGTHLVARTGRREDARLVVAGGDGPLRAVLRRMVRRVQPRGGDRTGLADTRTVPDLPAVGLLPVDPAGTRGRRDPDPPDLAARLGLPRAPAEVAAAALAGRQRRLDLLRTDAGSVTLHQAVLGGTDASGQPGAWRAVVNVDDVELSDGTEVLYACAVANAGRVEPFPGLVLVDAADPADGRVEVALAVPVGRRRPRVEVRRARGRAVTVSPLGPLGSLGGTPAGSAGAPAEVGSVDDGVAGGLRRRRTWWVEHAAWGVYVP